MSTCTFWFLAYGVLMCWPPDAVPLTWLRFGVAVERVFYPSVPAADAIVLKLLGDGASFNCSDEGLLLELECSAASCRSSNLWLSCLLRMSWIEGSGCQSAALVFISAMLSSGCRWAAVRR
ncbi:hypothetical protein Nepgr_018740 [Nepenthes gracilis]|uniref:Secreted protein n=1 Tax=Nepenthes gracilis TaxID=150966 RepID=A0AAD3STY4_NEPGR|nr:hypothetical protein Nepgr_018740 [Nepenthes gracilis]